MYLNSFINSRDNNFNLIRFFAAVAVLYSHCYPLSGKGYGPVESFFNKSWGGFAVDIFFISSGFLIANSFYRRKSSKIFIISRVLRIFPGLFIAVLFCALIVGVIFTQSPLTEYFADPNLIKYIEKNTLLVVGPIRYHLLGVFTNNPHVGAVNGSLWTLPYEVKMYFYLFTGGIIIDFIINKLKYKFNTKETLPKFLCLSITSIAICMHFFSNQFEIKDIEGVKLFMMFFIGANLYFFRNRIIINRTLFFISITSLLLLATYNLFFFKYAYVFLIPYILLYLVYIPKKGIRWFNNLGDYSYGIYIYAFPVQQSIIYLYPRLSIFEYFLISFVCTLLLSIFSWHIVEKKAMSAKNYLINFNLLNLGIVQYIKQHFPLKY